MKGLNIEEKAKAYDEALAHAKLLLKTIGNATLGNLVLKHEFEIMFPELKESEDEKDKCMLNNIINTLRPLSETTHSGYAINSMIAWLEKQGEQKSVEWTEEDESMLFNVIHRIEQLDHYWNKPTDEKMVYWLKSLRPQSHWKPSEEQIYTLEKATHIVGSKYKSCLNSLYSELKKLREE